MKQRQAYHYQRRRRNENDDMMMISMKEGNTISFSFFSLVLKTLALWK